MFSYLRRCDDRVTGVWSTAPASMRWPNTWGTLSCYQGPYTFWSGTCWPTGCDNALSRSDHGDATYRGTSSSARAPHGLSTPTKSTSSTRNASLDQERSRRPNQANSKGASASQTVSHPSSFCRGPRDVRCPRAEVAPTHLGQ